MTEWVVDNIAEAFEKNIFPKYKEIFDLFTRVFVQSRQVSVPMDILRMALYERVNQGKIEKKEIIKKDSIIQEEPQKAVFLNNPEHELPAPSHELPLPEIALPLPEKELPPESHGL